MKSLLILVLLVVLGAGAFLSRPTQADFKQYLVQQSTKSDGNILQKGFDEWRAKSFADSVVFKDRLLWVDVQKNGRTIYTGAFAHWFDHAALGDEVDKFKKS